MNGMKIIGTTKNQIPKVNPVAKHARKFNKSTVMIDRKKESKKNPKQERIDQYI